MIINMLEGATRKTERAVSRLDSPPTPHTVFVTGLEYEKEEDQVWQPVRNS